MLKEYLLLFNAITDAIRGLELIRNTLISAQQLAEELFIDSVDDLQNRPN